MDYKYIEQLLERYWSGGTSLEEEQILRSFFSQKDVPASLSAYKDLFCYEHSEVKDDVLGDDFDARMMALVDEPQPVKARTISITQRFMPLLKAVAVVALFITLGNMAQTVFTGGTNAPAGITTVQKPQAGLSVAMGDTAKADSVKAAPATAKILK